MKKALFYMMTAAVVIATSCGKDDEPEELQNQITMTTKQSNVAIVVTGSGTMTIDWGGGTEIETYTVPPSSAEPPVLTHAYSGSSTHTITIIGDDIHYLKCDNNGLTNLDLSRYPALRSLMCSTNPLKSLDVSNNPQLSFLNCNLTELTNLDVSNNPQLYRLICIQNQLTKLDLSKNTKLQYIYCQGNKLGSDALNAMFETLHDNIIILGQTKELYIAFNPGTSDCNISIAENKRWSVNLTND